MKSHQEFSLPICGQTANDIFAIADHCVLTWGDSRQFPYTLP